MVKNNLCKPIAVRRTDMSTPGHVQILAWCHKCGALQTHDVVDGRVMGVTAVKFPDDVEPASDCTFDED